MLRYDKAASAESYLTARNQQSLEVPTSIVHYIFFQISSEV